LVVAEVELLDGRRFIASSDTKNAGAPRRPRRLLVASLSEIEIAEVTL
jgi:hypothetical protein